MKDQKRPLRWGRKPDDGENCKFLATLDPDVIKALKLAAIEDDTSASDVLENAAKEWLEKPKKSTDADVLDTGELVMLLRKGVSERIAELLRERA